MDTTETNVIPLQSPSNFSPLRIELAKILKLVAPISMNAQMQAVWLIAATDALEGIRADEVAHISTELRRSIQRPAQIVPEIARLVSERRKHKQLEPVDTRPTLRSVHEAGMDRLTKARTRHEIEDAHEWERNALIEAGHKVDSRQAPLTRAELDALTTDLVSLGMKSGFLEWHNGKLCETAL